MVDAEHLRRRWLWTGCGLASISSLGLITLAGLYQFVAVNDLLMIPLVFALTILTGCGAMLAIFNLKRP